MRKALVLVPLCGLVAGLATPSLAATRLPKAKPLVVTDASGDASAGQKTADILSFKLGRKDDGKTVKAFVATMTLAAKPTSTTAYRIKMSTPLCSVYYLEYEIPPPVFKAGANVRHNCDAKSPTDQAKFEDVSAEIVGNAIVWTLPVKGMPGSAKLGTVLTITGAETLLDSGATVFPTLDSVATEKTFKIGQ